MAGSFDIFRKYQRSLLVFVAILAMLAFFVLPPFLQMGGSVSSSDPLVATWTGGELREGGLERALAMRSIVNRFLAESAAAAGRDPSRLPLFPETEEQVVRNLLLAKEAQANGIVVSDAAVNDFLGQWTGNLVRQEQFDEIISRLRLGPMAVSQHDLFAALRTELAARNMLMLFQSGFSANPPGWRWDYFRRLEQKAVVEVVPVIVEKLAGEAPAPSEQSLRGFFETYKDDLPEPRSADPGFREPHRVKYEYLVAKRDAFEAEAAKGITDEQIAEFYEKNKLTMFRVAPAAKTAESKPAESKPAESKPAESKPAEPKPAADGNQGGLSSPRLPVATVAFRQPAPVQPAPVSRPTEQAASAAAGIADPEKGPDAGKAAEKAPGMQPPGKTDEKATEKKEPEKKDPEKNDPDKKDADNADKKDADKKDAEPEVEPLEKVKDRIREQLARERAGVRVDEVFTAVAADLTRYAEDLALWQARRNAGVAPPRPPDLDAIAKTQGLEAVRSGLVAADAAVAEDAVGGSFEFVADPGSRFGIRQQRWVEMIYGSGAMPLRPVTSRDVAGNRYLSWKTEDQPAFVPSFETARADVERAWRIVEARGIAGQRAAKIVAAAASGKQSLEAALAANAGLAAGQPEMKAVQAGPFTWLMPGSAAAGVAPAVSQPDGLFMPGDDFMRAVFSLEPGETAVAFNEPRTVCYCIRLVSLDPPETTLRVRFLESKDDQSGPAMAAQMEFGAAFRGWIDGLDEKYGLDWKRQPRVPGR